MTTWELSACVDGWNAAHGPEETPEPPSDADFDRLLAGEHGA